MQQILLQKKIIDYNSKKIEKIGNGGLSGLPLRDKSNEVIKYIADKTQRSIPIIGVGGIMSPKDALDKIKAGADLIQLTLDLYI